VSPGSTTSSTGIRGGFGSASTLTIQNADALASKNVAPDIAAVAPTNQESESLEAGSENWTTTVVGTNPAWLSVRDRTVTEGRFLVNSDVTSHADVVVLAPTTAEELFPTGDAVGQSVTVNGLPMTVIGVLNSVGSSSGSTTDEDDQAIVPITTAADSIFGGTSRDTVSSILVEASSSNSLSAAYQEIDDELLQLHGITSAADADFTITSQLTVENTLSSTKKTLEALLAAMAVVSLIVGGIGVMNIMLVSVTERIKEIGLRKALGATPRAIRRQFLVEASVLGLVGGILGALIGILADTIIPHVVSDEVSISPTAAVGAIVVAIGIGVIAGVYPATRAARLAPIDALRGD
jgi:putative ABC transport system permease protein